MTAIRNIFNRGAQDKDSDKSAVPNGMTRHVENLRFHTNNGKDGVGVNIKGTLKVSDVTEGNSDLKCIGAYFNEDKDVIYYKLASSDGQISIDAEYNINLDTTSIVLKDTNGVLKYDKKGYITGWNEIDGLQFWSEWGNNPRRINTERAKSYGINGFTEDDIAVIVYPPLQKLRISLENTDTTTQEENNIEEKFIAFSYRYRYLDGEYSVLAPFTKFAFEPEKFRYDFSEQSNRSMINKFNQVKIEFNTGSERVTEIQLIFKESESEREWIIDDFDKQLLGYGHNEIKSFSFNNLKSKRALPPNVIRSFFDNVPNTVKAQTIIEGRLIYANYEENENIIDEEGNKILIDYELEEVHEENTVAVSVSDGSGGTEIVQRASLIPRQTCKSNRDYEVKLAYGFDYGRITTLLQSKNNTKYISAKHSVDKNSIDVILKHKPPVGAKYFKFFIRQNKKGYEQILPTLFYEDGTYRWIKLEGADKDKIKEGDYLIVKSDSSRVLQTLIKVKVLEMKVQKKNFLQPLDETSSISEIAGLYFKIKPKGFRIDLADYETFHLSTYHNSRESYGDALTSSTNWIGSTHFYGVSSNDPSNPLLVSNEGANSTLGYRDRRRYLIKIANVSGAVDKFIWSDDDGANWFGGGAGTQIPITSGVPQTLNNGLEITFLNDTGHDLSDEWNVNMRGHLTDSDGGRGYGYFRVNGDEYETSTDPERDIIFNGARLQFIYDEYKREYWYWELNEISSDKYDDIEEWFYKENIGDKILLIKPSFDLTHIHFVRGVIKRDGSVNGNASYINQDVNGFMTMVIRSQEHGTGTAYQKVRATSNVTMSDSDTLLIFETEPKDQPKELFHEIGRNYKIINGFHTNITDDYETKIQHIPTDQPQTSTQDLRVKLDWFNAWSFGNAVESYKIKDDFNAHSLDNGIRVLSSIKEEYKKVKRIADITWSDIYNDESDFNGLNSFNLSLLNFLKIDKEDGSIQKLFNANKNLLVYQEDAIGLMPYNRSVIQDVDGGKVVGISKNILNKDSYRPYADGLHGISLNPESFVAVGSRKYSTDRVRGDLLRLSVNGVTEINKYQFEHWFSDEMHRNKGEKLIGGYDPKHKEYYLYMPKTGTLVFTEKAKGFPFFLTIKPDLMLNANNEFYAWENGIMYRMNATEHRNNFFGKQYKSVLKFFVNTEYQTEKIFKALGLESTHAWLCNLKTDLTSRVIPKKSFNKKEDYWYSEIMGNTNNNTKANSIFGLGGYPIINGVITTKSVHNSLSVGDKISSKTLPLPTLQVVDIQGLDVILSSSVYFPASFLMYHKNQNIDGSPIRGDILEIEMISDETEKTEIRAVRTEVIKSNYS